MCADARTSRVTMPLRRRLSNLLLAASLAFCAASSAAAQTYTLRQINPPSGVDNSTVAHMNNLGQVVGNTSVRTSRSTSPRAPFIWTDGVSLSLPPLGADSSSHATAISDAGVIVGHSPANSPARAVWWQPVFGGGYEVHDWNDLLPENSPLILHDTVAISSDGQFVVFDAENSATGFWHAVVAQVDFSTGAMTTWSIDTAGNPPALVTDSLASDINNDGNSVRVVGFYGANTAHAFLWQLDRAAGTASITDLDDVSTRNSFANGVNSSAEVVGTITISGTALGYFWSAAGKVPLPTLGGVRSYPRSINDAGDVTGWSQRSGKNANAHAFLWRANVGIKDLNSLKAASDTSGIELTDALKTNNAGQILATGTNKSGSKNILLNPVTP